MRTPSRPKAIGILAKVRFKDRFQYHTYRLLYNPVFQGWDTQGADLDPSRSLEFSYVLAAYWRGLEPCLSEFLLESGKASLLITLKVASCGSVHSGGMTAFVGLHLFPGHCKPITPTEKAIQVPKNMVPVLFCLQT